MECELPPAETQVINQTFVIKLHIQILLCVVTKVVVLRNLCHRNLEQSGIIKLWGDDNLMDSI